MPCRIDLRPDRAEIDQHLWAGSGPTPVLRWANERNPDVTPLTRNVVQTHRRVCLGMPPIKAGKHGVDAKDVRTPTPPESPPSGPKPSEQLGHVVGDEDIETRMRARFYDLIDVMPPDKVAEWLIEREKTKNRAPAPARAKTPSEDEVPLDIAELRAAATRALGPSATRTAARRKA